MARRLHRAQPSQQIPVMKMEEDQVRNQGEAVVAYDDEVVGGEGVGEAAAVVLDLESCLRGVQFRVVAKVLLEEVGYRRVA